MEPSSVYLDGLGSLTLGNIQGGFVNTLIDVTARNDLTVTAGDTVDSGTSTLSLAADVNARRHRRQQHRPALDPGRGHGHL